ncbi:gas vesicle protein [Leptolyngbya sp. FACHB-261]|uniref:gas vesicle protein n=1 Tax=Leptolyngbya sp. FACHB-261 TaxID=2692806 RepID=UPI00168A0904|nr:gas vesicle protein [Leptolyngbya sp. FACHB-261]MBD2103907.1 gas vesicle protein [Leptolyngbya sp. FACHB-261]
MPASTLPNTPAPRPGSPLKTATSASSLADILERVLDKGIVIAGDVTISVGQVELLSIRIRLLISSVDKAREIGINWWESDPHLSSRAQELVQTNQQLLARIDSLERRLAESQVPEPKPSLAEPERFAQD